MERGAILGKIGWYNHHRAIVGWKDGTRFFEQEPGGTQFNKELIDAFQSLLGAELSGLPRSFEVAFVEQNENLLKSDRKRNSQPKSLRVIPGDRPTEFALFISISTDGT